MFSSLHRNLSRLGPENPLPTAHEDAVEALHWIGSHGGGNGPEPWINQYVDLDRVFLTGESAGANIAHYVAVTAGITKLSGLKIVGILIVHPFFVGKDPDKMIMFMYPTSSGTDSDPLLSPVSDPNVSEMAGERVLVCVAEKDWLKDRGVKYYETLCSVWKGKVEWVETTEEGHCFHMFKANEKAEKLIQRMAEFIKQT